MFDRANIQSGLFGYFMNSHEKVFMLPSRNDTCFASTKEM